VSYGFLNRPDSTDPDDLRRLTASASLFRQRSDGFTAGVVAYGRNDTQGRAFHAFLAEATNRKGSISVFGRFETFQAHTRLFRGVEVVGRPRGVTTAFTGGTLRELPNWRRFELGLGADVTLYDVPDMLRPSYGTHPISLHVFLRIRPPASPLGRLWDMTMSQAAKEMIR
jgi:hypothetical protein